MTAPLTRLSPERRTAVIRPALPSAKDRRMDDELMEQAITTVRNYAAFQKAVELHGPYSPETKAAQSEWKRSRRRLVAMITREKGRKVR